MTTAYGKMADEVFGALQGFIERRLQPLRVRLSTVIARQDSVEQRVVQLGERDGGSTLAYRGVFDSSQSYKRGELATFGGSAWIALPDTGDRPGPSDGWKLAVKRGEQGPRGEPGPIRPMLMHEWRGTELRFELRPGEWGDYVDLQGQQVRPTRISAPVPSGCRARMRIFRADGK